MPDLSAPYPFYVTLALWLVKMVILVLESSLLAWLGDQGRGHPHPAS